MAVLGTLIIGFIVGLVARIIKPGNDQMGIIMTTILGIVGAFVGGAVGRAFGVYGANDTAGFIAATIGAIFVLFIAEALFGRKRAV